MKKNDFKIEKQEKLNLEMFKEKVKILKIVAKQSDNYNSLKNSFNAIITILHNS